MTKRKMYVFAAALAVAVVGVYECGKMPHQLETNGCGKMPHQLETNECGKSLFNSQLSTFNLPMPHQRPTVRGTLPYVLTSKVPFTKPLRLEVEAVGVKTVGTISRNALLIEADEATRARLAGDSRFDGIAEFTPSRKIQPALAAMIAGGAKSVDVSLVALSAEDRRIVISCLEQGGGEMLRGCINEGDTIRAKLPADLVAMLAARGDVRWMEKFEYPKLMNDMAVTNVAMNVQEVWNTYGLTGKGQVLSTSDTGIDTGYVETMHPDLTNAVMAIRVVPDCSYLDTSGHGTHTAGSIVGDGTMSTNQIRGTAWGAKLCAWFCDGGSVGILTPGTCAELFRGSADGTAWPAFIHSASWGSAVGGAYITDCANYDKYVWEHPEFLPVFSAGNEGSGNFTIASPATAKNVLAVGATQNVRSGHDNGRPNGNPAVTTSFSSRGPCQDWRIKPDIAAPGAGIVSTRSFMSDDTLYGVYEANTNYLYCSGTSMSCPLTAGAVALVRQWLVETNKIERPTAALMKAVIMGGARGVVTPNNDQGWGCVDLADTLFPTNGRAVKLIDRIPFEQGFVTNIVIETTNAAPLDVQLVWIDYPGNADASQTLPKLVNDLDLTVLSRIPGEPTVRYGNGGDKPDTLNNVESVRIENAVPHKYVITVDCKTILHDYTEGGAAALYIRGAFDPAAEADEPAYVHLKKQNRNFISLDRALEAVKDDDETVEICDWVRFENPVTLTNRCTIVATNADAAVSYIDRQDGAMLTVATSATVALSNVVFTASPNGLVEVDGGGCLKLGPKVTLGQGGSLEHVAIRTMDADGFELAGEPTERLMLHCRAATQLSQPFGRYSCDYLTASNCAPMIVCADDEDRETCGRADQATGRLVWGHVAVPVEDSAGYFVDNAGKTNAYYRMEKALQKFQASYGNGTASAFCARTNGVFGLSFRGDFAVSSPLVFSSTGGVRQELTATDMSGFEIVDGGSLTISNLVFRGHDAGEGDVGFVEVNGGELELQSGATLDGIVGRSDFASGVIDLFLGTVTLCEGASIINCKALGWGYGEGCGGAIYTSHDDGCVLNLEGGVITNCYASSCGGGVYAAGYGNDARINISGKLTIVDNCSSDTLVNDNLYMFWSDALPGLRLVDEVRGGVGIRYYDDAINNKEGAAFMTNAVGAVSRKTLRAIFNDTDGTLTAATNANGMLVWVVDTYDPRRCEEGEEDQAAAKLIAGDDVSFWWKVSDALSEATNNCVVEVMRDTNLTESVSICGTNITLRSVEGNPYGLTLYRGKDVQVSVEGGAALIVTNIDLCGRVGVESSMAFLNVNGGILSLLDADIFDIVGRGDRNANAVTVTLGGKLVMDGGSQIDSCYNYSVDPTGVKETEVGVGGGILIDNAMAFFRNGYVSNCKATHGGGVFACNDSVVYISGLMRILNNTTPDGADSNLELSDNAKLIVDGELTGRVYETPKTLMLTDPSDTNLIAKVDYAWSFVSLTNSAVSFKSDVSHDVGVAVTNGTKALIVWSQALKDGKYVNASDEKTYALAGKMPDIRQCDHDDEYLALARLIDEKGAATYWWRVDDALGEATNNAVVEVFGDDVLSKDIVIRGTNITLRSPAYVDPGFCLCRAKDVAIIIPADCELAISNVSIDGGGGDGPSDGALFDVCGGRLGIGNVSIYDVAGAGTLAASAIVVKDGGTFAMTNSQISACTNAVVGGGMLVDGATAYLLDGFITDCRAPRGGGVFACNGAKLYVGGQMCVCDNEAVDGVTNNIVLADSADLILTNALTGLVYMTPRGGAESNLVAHVGYAWTNDLVALTNSAAGFVSDADGDVGLAVTNGTKALIVWCGAVRNGVYTNAADKVEYRTIAVTPAKALLPPLVSVADVANELAKLADATVAEKIETLDEYNDFCEWASNVAGGKEAVVSSDKAYVSYEFGATELFKEDPTVEITETETVGGELKVSVVVRDGEDPVAVASEKVAEMFEATSDVGDWSAKLDLTVNDLTQANATVIRFTVKPAGSPTKVFIRLKY